MSSGFAGVREAFRVRFLVAAVMTGVMAGVGGVLLGLLLHIVQHVAFGYSLHAIISEETFLQGVSAAPPLRRLSSLTVGGVVSGVGLWLLYRYGRPLVGIAAALKAEKPHLPVAETILGAVLQIITVGLGSPLGREVAPRQVGAALASVISERLGLIPQHTRLLIASGAGAGLAAVYNVPLSGFFFTIEVLLGGFRADFVLAAMLTSSVATLVGHLAFGNEIQYQVPALQVTPALLAWSALMGPVFGCAARGFVRLTDHARERAMRGSWLIPSNIAAFVVVGVLAMALPQLPGNGKGAAELGFSGALSLKLAAVLLCCKIAVQWGSIRAGAQGGLLTPALSNGALLSCLLGGWWSCLWPGTAQGAFAIVGGTAVLGVAMRMPITAVIFVFELTRVSQDFIIPMALALSGALFTHHCLLHGPGAPNKKGGG